MTDPQKAENLYWMLLQVAFRSKYGLIKLADAHDLTVVQLHTLCIMDPGQPVPMNAISGMLVCDASNVTGIVDRLLLRGHIKRQEKPEDRRVKMITLTPKGELVRQQVFDTFTHYELPELHMLNETERKELKRLLSRILSTPALEY